MFRDRGLGFRAEGADHHHRCPGRGVSRLVPLGKGPMWGLGFRVRLGGVKV